MTASQLMTDLARLAIRIEGDGDHLRYSPRSAVTPELLHQMKTNKTELLAILRRGSAAPTIDPDEPLDADDWPANTVPFDDLPPCRHCGRLELWQTFVGDWRCLRCDPPTAAIRWQERTARIKARR